MIQVAITQFALNDNLGITQYKTSLARIAVEIHKDVLKFSQERSTSLKKHYVTSTSFLDLLNIYLLQLKKYQNILPLQIRKYQVGLTTIQKT
jgi:hypothetical protein